MNSDPRLQKVASDLFLSCAEGEWRYIQMRSAQLVACPAAALPSDASFVERVNKVAEVLRTLFDKHLRVIVDVREHLERYLRMSKDVALDAGSCLSSAIGDILREIHLTPNPFLISIGELLRWLRGEITLAVAAVRAGVRWAIKAVSVWGAQAFAVIIGSNIVLTALIITGAIFLARLLARAVLGF